MQTFMPYSDYKQVAKCLDRQRLGKQRVECKQILKAILHGGGWTNHPAVKMWVGYEHSLCVYAMEMCEEWELRGYTDNLYEEFYDKANDLPWTPVPWWVPYEKLILSHRSNLLRKNYFYYRRFGWDVPDNIPYYWPE